MGSETQAAMRLGGHDLIGVFRERVLNAPGEILNIGVETDNIHLFDTETGKRPEG